jgi:hypothetical protein
LSVTRFRFELAQASDEAGLRRVLATTPMPGQVTVSLEREPNYFAAGAVQGPEHQTILCRDTESAEIVGVATRCVRPMYVAGAKVRVGYLGGLRLVKRVRRRGLLARGYRFVRKLHESDPAAPPFYLTTIAEGNDAAILPLTSGRAGLPTYQPLGRLHTFVIPIGKRIRGAKWESLAHGRIAPLEDYQTLLTFLNACGPRKTFFPVYQADDFGSPATTFRGLDRSAIVVATRDDRVIGAAGIWDQRSFRQTRVQGYSPALASLRPLINQWSRLSGGVYLPKVGESLAGCVVAFPVVADDDPQVFHALLRRLMQIAPADASVMLVGLCDADPLLSVAARLSRSRYTTRLYAVSWDRQVDSLASACDQPYYLELGCL